MAEDENYHEERKVLLSRINSYSMWGKIIGTVQKQTDLMDLLDTKANVSYVDEKLLKTMHLQDSVQKASNLPSASYNTHGDVRYVSTEGTYYVWDKNAWNSFFNATNYYTKTQVDTELNKKQNVLTEINAGNNITITTESGIVKINSIGGGGGGGTVDAYTKAESDARFATKASEHEHENKVVLDDLSVSSDGTLLFRNKPCGSIPTKVYNNSYTGITTEEELALDISEIVEEQDIYSIYNQEITIKNYGVTALAIKIYQEDVCILDLSLESNEIQSYILNHNKNLKIYIKGNYKLIYDMIGF